MRLAATVGFLFGMVPPLVRGFAIIVDDLCVREPHTCGLGLLAGWMHILYIAPIGGTLGAAIGCGCRVFYRAIRHDQFSN